MGPAGIVADVATLRELAWVPIGNMYVCNSCPIGACNCRKSYNAGVDCPVQRANGRLPRVHCCASLKGPATCKQYTKHQYTTTLPSNSGEQHTTNSSFTKALPRVLIGPSTRTVISTLMRLQNSKGQPASSAASPGCCLRHHWPLLLLLACAAAAAACRPAADSMPALTSATTRATSSSPPSSHFTLA